MATVFLSPIFNGWQGFTPGGLPLSGGFINTYQAGTATPAITYTTSSGNVANSNPIVLGPDGRPPFEIWITQGQAYKFVLTDSLGLNPITYDNIFGVGDNTLFLATLATAVGSTLVGWTQSGTGAVLRTVSDKLREAFTPKDFGAVGNGVTPDDSALNVAFSAAKVANIALDLGSLQYAITAPLVLDGFNSFNLYSRGAALIGPLSTSMTSMIDLKNTTDFNVHGRLGLAGNYNLNLGCGIWIHADSGVSCSLINIYSMAFSGCKVAYRIGDVSLPTKTISEISIYGGYTYGCPNVVQLEGAESVACFNGCTLTSDYGGGGASWQALTQTTVRAIGGLVRINGGEVNHATSTLGSMFDVQPITSAPEGNPYGNIVCVGVQLEPASQLATGENLTGVVTPSGGQLSFDSCGGFHSQNSFAFIQTSADFPGKISLINNNFFCSVARTQPNIQCANPLTDVYCDEQSFGTNFLTQLNGIVGGNAHFRNKLIFAVSTPNNTINSGVLDIVKYQSVSNFTDSARFTPGYSTSTGRWTATQPLKDVSIKIGFSAGAATPTDVFFAINGTTQDTVMSVTGAQGMVAFVKSISTNDIIDVRAQPNGANITPSANSFNHFKIMASN